MNTGGGARWPEGGGGGGGAAGPSEAGTGSAVSAILLFLGAYGQGGDPEV